MSNDLIVTIVLFLFGQLVTAAAIWGAIRSDIRNIMTRLNDFKTAVDRAHGRIDDLITGHSHHRESNGQ